MLGLLVCTFVCNSNISQAASDLTVVYPKEQSVRDPRQAYFMAMLNLALECTRATHGGYQLKVYEEQLPPIRVPFLIQQDKLINIMSSPVTGYLNNSMRAIPFPLLMGIQGIRVALVHQDNQQIFSKVNKLGDFKKTIFGQGLGWVDTLILQNAKLNVDTSGNYESLFAMLSNKRIDAFPRGINEVLQELERFKADYNNLVLEPNVAFYYPLPVYFYVARNNSDLADRILLGLTIAVKEGLFAQLFEQYYAEALAQLNLPRRKVFILKNHHLPADTESQMVGYLHPLIKTHFTTPTNKVPVNLTIN